jgi:ankyrin repeat protein
VAFNIHQLAIFAARSDNVPLLLERLAAGGNLNHVNPHLGSALAAAAMKGNLSMVEWLLQHGADPNLAHGDFVGPLEIALRHTEAGIV